MEESNKKILRNMQTKRTSSVLTRKVMYKDDPERQKIVDRIVETKLTTQGAEKWERKESEGVKDEEGGRSDSPNTQMQEAVVFGKRSASVGGKDEYGKRQAYDTGGEVQHERGRTADDKGKGMNVYEGENGTLVYERKRAIVEMMKVFVCGE